eukprot:6179620-Pleurochrysis_carterae.AAC.2
MHDPRISRARQQARSPVRAGFRRVGAAALPQGLRRPGELHLYSAFLKFLLRINERAGGGDPDEIASRTKEVLDQFEREPEQQQARLDVTAVLHSVLAADRRGRPCVSARMR